MASSRVAVVAIIASLAFACEDEPGGAAVSPGPSSGGIPAGGPLPPGTTPTAGVAGEFCQKTLGVVIGALESCCTSADKSTQDYQFVRAITGRFLPVCKERLEASIQKDRVRWRQQQGDACYAAYASTYGHGKCENITQTYADPSGVACRDAFTGVGGDGAPCSGDHECMDGLTCVGYTDASDGACKPPPAIGEPCGPGRGDEGVGSSTLGFGTHPACVSGARCGIDGTCVKAASEGEGCTSDDTCAEPLRCLMGKCSSAAPAGEGGPCLRSDDCTPDRFCEAASPGTPGACRTKRAAGGACTGATFVTECAGRCDAAPGTPGQCVAFCGSP